MCMLYDMKINLYILLFVFLFMTMTYRIFLDSNCYKELKYYNFSLHVQMADQIYKWVHESKCISSCYNQQISIAELRDSDSDKKKNYGMCL